MNTKKAVLIIGMVAIAIVCFRPPLREVRAVYMHSSVDGAPLYKTVKMTDYYKLATMVTGIAALTGAVFLCIPQRRRVVDAGRADVVTQH